MRTTVLALVFLCGALVVEAADSVWRGPVVTQDYIEKKHVQHTPIFAPMRRKWILKGDGVVPLEEIEKVRGQHYVIRGRESADGKSIVVKEMKIQTEWEGRVHIAFSPVDSKYNLQMFCENDTVTGRLIGAGVVPLEQCEQPMIWVIKGEQKSDFLIEVKEMKLKDPQPPLDPRFKKEPMKK